MGVRIQILLGCLLWWGCGVNLVVPHSFSSDFPDQTAMELNAVDIQCFVEHLPDDKHQMIFDVEVVNRGIAPYFFDPSNIQLYMSNEPFPVMDTSNPWLSSAGHVRRQGGNAALHPRSAEEVNRSIRKRIRTRRGFQAGMLVLGTALIVSDVIQDVNDASKEFFSSRDVQRSLARDAATASAIVAMDVAGTNMERDIQRRMEDLEYLPEEYLHETMLAQGSSVRGKVFFPRRETYNFYRLIVRVDDWGYVFDFRRPSSRERKALRRLGAID